MFFEYRILKFLKLNNLPASAVCLFALSTVLKVAILSFFDDIRALRPIISGSFSNSGGSLIDDGLEIETDSRVGFPSIFGV